MNKLLKSLTCILLLDLHVTFSHALQPGDKVTTEDISGSEAVKGKLPAAWEEGKVYIIECWATWCTPCVAAIPHLDGYHDKYHEKGLRVLGMSVWEDDFDKVKSFVEKKGEGMSYPVAFVGNGGGFEQRWLKAANVKGIPYAFVVKDGVLLFGTYPWNLNDGVVETILSGSEGIEKVSRELAEKQAKADASRAALDRFHKASLESDTGAMETALEEIRKQPEHAKQLPSIEFRLAVAKKQWNQIAEILRKSKEEKTEESGKSEKYGYLLADAAAEAAEKDSGASVEFREMLASEIGTIGTGGEKNIILARLYWSLGRKNEAKRHATEALDDHERMADAGRFTPVKTMRKFVASLNEDVMMTQAEFMRQMHAEVAVEREAINQKAEKARQERAMGRGAKQAVEEHKTETAVPGEAKSSDAATFLKNSSFDKQLEPWKCKGGKIVTDSEDAKNSVMETSIDDGVFGLEQDFQWPSGKDTLKLTFRVKASTASAEMPIQWRLRIYDAKGVSGIVAAGKIEETDKWLTFTKTIQKPELQAASIYLESNRGQGTIWIDDFRFE